MPSYPADHRPTPTPTWTVIVPSWLAVVAMYAACTGPLYWMQAAGTASLFGAAALWLLGYLPGRLLLLAALGFGLIVRLSVATAPPEVLQEAVVSEDAYYYFNIARNIAAGNGPRHDSYHLTTGFQPLFALLLVPIFSLLPEGDDALRVVMICLAFIGLGSGLCVAALAARIGGSTCACVAATLWAASPELLRMDTNGQETGLALLALCGTALFYVDRFRAEHPPGWWSFALLGGLVGLCFWVRMDLALLGPAVLADMALCRRRCLRATLPRLMVTAACAALVACPWLLYNLAQGGSPMPDSGRATRLISQAYGHRFLDHLMYWSHSYGEARHIEVGAPPLSYLLASTRLGLQTLWITLAEVLSGLLLVPVLLLGLWRRRRRLLRRLAAFRVLFLFSLLIFISYTSYIFGHWFFDRYFAPVLPAYLLLSASALGVLLPGRDQRVAVARRHPWSRAAALALLGLGLLPNLTSATGWVLDARDPNKTLPGGFLETARWLNAHTEPDAVIGVFQSGIIGYHLNRRFVALDGKVNRGALEALEARTMSRYLVSRGVTHVADWDWVINDLLRRRSRQPELLDGSRLVRLRTHDVHVLARGFGAPLPEPDPEVNP